MTTKRYEDRRTDAALRYIVMSARSTPKQKREALTELTRRQQAKAGC